MHIVALWYIITMYTFWNRKSSSSVIRNIGNKFICLNGNYPFGMWSRLQEAIDRPSNQKIYIYSKLENSEDKKMIY